MDATELPVIAPLPGDGDDQGHEQVIVGYEPRGLITQNSWGLRFGCRGRAILSWEWVALHVKAFLPEGIDDKPINPIALPLPAPRVQVPALVTEAPMFLFKKADKPAVWGLHGSGKVWFRNRTDAERQGVDVDAAVVLEPTHVYYNDVYYPVIGAGPAAAQR